MSGQDQRSFWDDRAATFDDEPDHGLTDAVTHDAWAALLDGVLGESTEAVLDLGCGTGSISILLAQRGHRVLAVDVSPKMIEQAVRKADALGLDVEFSVGDVETMIVPATTYGTVVSRHLLWAVGDLDAVITRWIAQLSDDGVFVAIEGEWNGAGTASDVVVAALEQHFGHVSYLDLSGQSELWGKDVTDHRYVVVGRHPTRRLHDRRIQSTN